MYIYIYMRTNAYTCIPLHICMCGNHSIPLTHTLTHAYTCTYTSEHMDIPFTHLYMHINDIHKCRQHMQTTTFIHGWASLSVMYDYNFLYTCIYTHMHTCNTHFENLQACGSKDHHNCIVMYTHMCMHYVYICSANTFIHCRASGLCIIISYV